MSIIDSTSQQICNAPTNQSKAKMLYSFPKSPRFPKNKQNQCDRFYEIGGKTDKRATNLGYGNKYDFTRDSPKTPAPGMYETNSLFQQSKRYNKGFGFGSGRNQMEATGLIKKNFNPGPGAYEISANKSRISSSLKGKGKIDDRQQRYVPGPGSYQIKTTFNKTGKMFCSRFKTKQACRFGRDQKLKLENRNVPGPGSYQSVKTQFSPQGRYFLSRLQSAKVGKFGKSSRMQNQNRCQTPGPGNYRLPSQFGYYVSRNILQQRNKNISQQI